MTVYIFGDSYGAISSRGKRYRAWFDMIEEPIVNKCKGSASPYYCLRRLNEEIDNITENDKNLQLNFKYRECSQCFPILFQY